MQNILSLLLVSLLCTVASAQMEQTSNWEIHISSVTLNLRKHTIWIGDQIAAGSYDPELYSRAVMADEKPAKHTLAFSWYADTLSVYVEGFVPYVFTNLHEHTTNLTISDLVFTRYRPLDTLITYANYYTNGSVDTGAAVKSVLIRNNSLKFRDNLVGVRINDVAVPATIRKNRENLLSWFCTPGKVAYRTEQRGVAICYWAPLPAGF